ncbi:YgaP family membrane protein [Halochromatium sp.]
MNLIKNVGQTDRNIRYAAAGILVLIGIVTGPWWLTLLGLILLGTAYFGSCAAYIPLGIDTTKSDQD